MGLFGLFKRKEKTLQPANTVNSWYTISEPFTGAWQRNIKLDRDSVLKNKTVFACTTLIAGDISKLSVRLQRIKGEIWINANNKLAPVLIEPNHYQDISQFIEQWLYSKLTYGNTYILKGRDSRGKIAKLYILDPRRVTPLVADDGSVFYQLASDNLSGLMVSVTAPASEIIHDRYNCLFHPLVGLSPLYANSVVAAQGNNIQENSALFFGNMSRPSGILTAPGAISNETAARLKTEWQASYSGNNVGKVAVLADGLNYQAIAISALDSQLIEQLKYTDEAICSSYQVPPYKVGIGQMPTYNNISALNLEYYSTCLQRLVQAIEHLLTKGLELNELLRVNLNEDDLIRMDKATLYTTIGEGVSRGWMKIDEGRAKVNLPPVEGGDSCYIQQQNFSLQAIARRDSQESTSTNDVQATALNGAQVTALQGLIMAVAAGEMPKETAKQAILAAFPLMTQQQVDDMIDPINDIGEQTT